MQISQRLKEIAGYVSKGSIVADVGCDHGLTSIYLAANNIAKKVYALDINKGPLDIAKRNIAASGYSDKIETRLSDGLAKINEEDGIDSVVISGMGGRLIMGILEAYFDRGDIRSHAREMILSPQSDVHMVRRFLHEKGYSIQKEDMVYDSGKYYNIIYTLSGREDYYDDAGYMYGKLLIEGKSPVFIGYIENELEKKSGICKKIESEKSFGNSSRLLSEYNRVTDEISVLKGIINNS